MKTKTRLAPAVRRDLSRELKERVKRDIAGLTSLAEDPADMFEISLGALVQAVAMSAGFFSAHVGRREVAPYDLTIALIETLRSARDQDHAHVLDELATRRKKQ